MYGMAVENSSQIVHTVKASRDNAIHRKLSQYQGVKQVS